MVTGLFQFVKFFLHEFISYSVPPDSFEISPNVTSNVVKIHKIVEKAESQWQNIDKVLQDMVP